MGKKIDNAKKGLGILGTVVTVGGVIIDALSKTQTNKQG